MTIQSSHHIRNRGLYYINLQMQWYMECYIIKGAFCMVKMCFPNLKVTCRVCVSGYPVPGPSACWGGREAEAVPAGPESSSGGKRPPPGDQHPVQKGGSHPAPQPGPIAPPARRPIPLHPYQPREAQQTLQTGRGASIHHQPGGGIEPKHSHW